MTVRFFFFFLFSCSSWQYSWLFLDGNVGMPETESGTIINKASLSQTVSVFHINCNYLRNKMGELMMVSKTYGRYLKIICVTETMQIAEINIPNFVTCRKDRLNCREGGGSFNCSDSIVYCNMR